GLAVTRMVSDVQAWPANPGHWTCIVDAARHYLVPPQGPARVVDGLDPTALVALLAAETPTPQTPWVVHAAAVDARSAHALGDALHAVGWRADVRLWADGVLAHLAAGAVSAQPINLLQGPYALAASRTARLGAWRAAAALAVALGMLVVA